MTDSEQLLLEWLQWWRDADEVPAKLPNGLHVRTAVHLLTGVPKDQVPQIARDILEGSVNAEKIRQAGF